MPKTTRRRFLSALALGAAALSTPAPSLAAKDKKKRPNIILFITDDQDKHSIGAYGGDSSTPNLDRMAREGVLFHNAYVASTVCTPSRYSFLTGRYAGRAYGERYLEQCPPGRQGYPSFNMNLEEDNLNVGGVLQKSGYATGYVGKFHVGPDIKKPKEHAELGLEYVARDASPDAKASAAFRKNELWYRRYLQKKGFSWTKHIYWGNLQAPFARHNPEWTTEAALEFIEEHKDRPFYLHYCTTLTHGPDKSWSQSMEHPRVSGEGMLDAPAQGMTDRQALLKGLKQKGLDPEAGHAGYAQVDDSVGALLKKLDQLGIADNTLVVFIADHGSNLKSSLFDVDGVNVPCIARWPNGIQAGKSCDELIQNIDFAPTFFDMANADIPEKYLLDGRSLLPLFQEERPRAWRNHLYFEIGAARAVRTKEWKYIAVRYNREQTEQIRNCSDEDLPKRMAYIGRVGIGTRGSINPNFFDADQLYDIRRDPLERKNLAADPAQAKRLKAMRSILRQYLQSFARPFGEFVEGGDAVPAGSIDDRIALVKRIKIEGKKITLPQGQTPNEPKNRPVDREKRREEKQKARAAKRPK